MIVKLHTAYACNQIYAVTYDVHTLQHVLIGLYYGDFNWEVVSTDFTIIEGDEETKVPSLFIEFGENDENQLLQIISKQVESELAIRYLLIYLVYSICRPTLFITEEVTLD